MDKVRNIHLEKTWKVFFNTLIGIIFPFIISLLPIMALSKYGNIFTFLDNGQVLLFGAGLYTSSHFLFSENINSLDRVIDKILKNIVFWALVICSAFFAFLYTIQILDIKCNINIHFIRIFSLLLFILAVFSLYRSVYIDSKKVYPDIDIKKTSQQGVDNILGQL